MSYLDTIQDEKLVSGISKAREAGKSDEEIFSYLSSKGLIDNPLEKISEDKIKSGVSKAREAGKSDLDIINYLYDKRVLNYDEKQTELQQEENNQEENNQEENNQESLLSKIRGKIKGSKEDYESKYGAMPKDTLGVASEAVEPIKEEIKNLENIDPESFSSSLMEKTDSPEEILAKAKTLKTTYFDEIKKSFKSLTPEISAEVEQTQKELNSYLVKKLQALGEEVIYDTEKNQILILEEGKERILDDSLMQDILARKGEFVGGVYGASAGARFGTAGMIVGGAVGAATGAGLDRIVNAFELKEDLDKNLLLSNIAQAASLDLLGSAIGLSVFKLYSMKPKELFKLKNVIDRLRVRDHKTAARDLKDLFGLSDDEVAEQIKKLEDLYQTPLPGTQAQKEIRTIVTSMPGSEKLFNIVKRSPEATINISKEISDRSRAVVEAANKLTHGKTSQEIITEISNYEDTVKQYYRTVLKPAEDLKENIDRNILRKSLKLPLVMNMLKRAKDDSKVKALNKIADRMGSLLDDNIMQPSLANFIELQKDLKSTVRTIKDPATKKQMNTIIKGFEKSLNQEAKKHLGAKWVSEWKKANIEYSKMKDLEKNKFIEAIKKSSGDEETMSKLVSKFSARYDVWKEALEKLPPKTRKVLEGKMLEQKIKAATVGSGDQQATHFVLAKEKLDNVDVFTPEAKKLKWLVSQMSETMRNDAILNKSLSSVSLSEIQSTLSDSVVAKGRFELIKNVYSEMRRQARFLPSGRDMNLAQSIAEVLEDPLDVKNVKDLLKTVPDDKGLLRAVEQYRRAYVSFGEKSTKAKSFITAYRASKFPRRGVKGQLGYGTYYSLDKDKIANRASKLKLKVTEEKIPVSRLARESEIKQAMGVREFNFDDLKNNKNAYIQKLRQEGFLGTLLDDEVVLWKK